MTKVIDLTIPQGGEVEKKKIEFVKSLESSTSISKASIKPSEYEHIELIAKECCGVYDVMFAYNDDRSDGVIYLGLFNDGVV